MIEKQENMDDNITKKMDLKQKKKTEKSSRDQKKRKKKPRK